MTTLFIFFGFAELTIGCYDDVSDKTCPKRGWNLHLFGHNPKFFQLDHHFTCWNKLLSKIYKYTFSIISYTISLLHSSNQT
jgi:hypothetical protein